MEFRGRRDTPEDRFKIEKVKVQEVGPGCYENFAVVTVPGATDSDLSHYCNADANPGIDIEKFVPEGSVDDYLAAHCADDRFDCDVLRAIASANRNWGKPTGAGIVDMNCARPW